MDSREFFRRFLGFPRNPSRPHFDEDFAPEERASRDDDGFGAFFGDSSRGLEGMFEHFHGDMWRQMDALHRQMEEMMRGFGAIDFHSSVDLPQLPAPQPIDPGKQEGTQVFSWNLGPTPFFRHPEKKSPRDFMLKEGADSDLPSRPALPASPGTGHKTKFDGLVPFNIPGSHNSGDTDLDGKISEDKLLELIKQPKQKISLSQDVPGVLSAKKSVSVSTFRGPDNKIEHKRIVRDSSGREESTITRTIGDKSYTVTTVTETDGSQQQHQTFKNMDETQVSHFEDEWNKKKPIQPRSPADPVLTPKAGSLLDLNDRGLFTRIFDWKDQ
ncbi:unnamed protein product [Candidula unifasciata]|uniref:HCLS1-associated protein X-1 n=1 Tax=Candidula unifasciata TaxID=100452 RepID=A0A8S3ZE88_9EUPU|nr:unnamed protein product [Candidula unifasciata]